MMSKGAPDGFEPETPQSLVQRGATKPAIAAAEIRANLAIYALTLSMYTVASPDPDPNVGGRGSTA